MTMESTKLRNILEGALLAAGQPLNLNRLKSLFEEDEQPEKEDILAALEAIATDCEGRGFELKEVGSGWRFQVRNEVAPWINRLWEEKPQKYSRALLETLALVAYRQPITRGDIEEIRGVAVSSHIIKTLTEREWVKVVGHRDVPGRPSLYATTRQFLDYFNLKSLDELPSLGEIRDLNDLNKVLDWDETPEPSGEAQDNDAEEAGEEGEHGDVESSDSGNAVVDQTVPDEESVEGSVDTDDLQDADTEPTSNEGGSKSLFEDEDSDNESDTSSAHNHESNIDADKSSL